MVELTKSNRVNINSLKEMKEFAEQQAKLSQPNDIILLKGNLGSGKTTFSQFFIRCLCGNSCDVISPTFNIVLCYDSNHQYKINHIDLYRIESVEELENLAIDDLAENNITLVEWPEKAGNFFDDFDCKIIEIQKPENSDNPEERIINSFEN